MAIETEICATYLLLSIYKLRKENKLQIDTHSEMTVLSLFKPVLSNLFGLAGHKVDRRRREDRGAEGTDGVGCGEEVSPSPLGEGLRRGHCPSPEIFSIFELKMVSFGAFLV